MDPMDPPAAPAPASAAVCALCRTPLPDPCARCPACGMHPARNLDPAAKWRVAAGLAAVYALVAIVLVLTR